MISCHHSLLLCSVVSFPPAFHYLQVTRCMYVPRNLRIFAISRSHNYGVQSQDSENAQRNLTRNIHTYIHTLSCVYVCMYVCMYIWVGGWMDGGCMGG